MDDCISLPNAAELVEELKNCADCAGGYCTEACGESLFKIADFVEALLAENAKLKAERDAIRDALVAGGTYCDICKKYISCLSSEDCKGEKFEWRGVQKEEEDGKIH